MIKPILITFFFCYTIFSFSQVGINTITPSNAAVLEVASSSDGINFGGFMPPRVDALGRANIAAKATAADEGLIIYFEDTRCMQIWNGTTLDWEDIFCMPGGGSTASDLFISEYVEGSGNNKAIEIANFTGAPVDLSNYNLRFYFNGNSTGGNTITLSGMLLDGEVYVVSENDANATILAQADQTDNGSFFNGNDAIELRFNTTVIDEYGNVGTDSNYGTDETFIRRPGFGPNSAYDNAEYQSTGANNFSGLGSHTY